MTLQTSVLAGLLSTRGHSQVGLRLSAIGSHMMYLYFIPVDTADVRGPWQNSCNDGTTVMVDGRAVPVLECSEAMNQYLMLRDILLDLHNGVGKGSYSEAEDPITERMDRIWSDIPENERAYIRRQGRWKFASPPA